MFLYGAASSSSSSAAAAAAAAEPEKYAIRMKGRLVSHLSVKYFFK
jgi:hypothetical protein